MRAFWRFRALPIGLVLMVLGLGNWGVSRTKVIEYSRRAGTPEPVESRASYAEFQRLTARTNARLLQGLHRGAGDYRDAEAKRDFYTVLQSGGRFFTLVGVLLVGVATLQHWRRRRLVALRAAA
jgi:hypothetical protein